MLREQLTFSAAHNLQIWIREHQPDSVETLVSIAEAYQLAHKETESRKFSFRFQNKTGFGKLPTDQGSSECLKPDSGSFFNKQSQYSNKRKCFICDSTEHLLAKCPFKIKEAQKVKTVLNNRKVQSLICSFLQLKSIKVIKFKSQFLWKCNQKRLS